MRTLNLFIFLFFGTSIHGSSIDSYYTGFVESLGIDAHITEDGIDCTQSVALAVYEFRNTLIGASSERDLLLLSVVDIIDHLKYEVSPECRIFYGAFAVFMSQYFGDAENLRHTAEKNFENHFLTINQSIEDAMEALELGDDYEAGRAHAYVLKMFIMPEKCNNEPSPSSNTADTRTFEIPSHIDLREAERIVRNNIDSSQRQAIPTPPEIEFDIDSSDEDDDEERVVVIAAPSAKEQENFYTFTITLDDSDDDNETYHENEDHDDVEKEEIEEETEKDIKENEDIEEHERNQDYGISQEDQAAQGITEEEPEIVLHVDYDHIENGGDVLEPEMEMQLEYEEEPKVVEEEAKVIEEENKTEAEEKGEVENEYYWESIYDGIEPLIEKIEPVREDVSFMRRIEESLMNILDYKASGIQRRILHEANYGYYDHYDNGLNFGSIYPETLMNGLNTCLNSNSNWYWDL